MADDAEKAEEVAKIEEELERPAHMPFPLSQLTGEQPAEDDESALGTDEVRKPINLAFKNTLLSFNLI